MAKRVFKADLSVKGIESLKKQLRDYQQELVTVKVQELVKRLLERGEQVSQAKISESPLGKYVSITTNISPEKAGCKGMLIAVGAVKESEGFPPFLLLSLVPAYITILPLIQTLINSALELVRFPDRYTLLKMVGIIGMMITKSGVIRMV